MHGDGEHTESFHALNTVGGHPENTVLVRISTWDYPDGRREQFVYLAQPQREEKIALMPEQVRELTEALDGRRTA